MGVLGIRAIRNERFRIEKQIEQEHRRASDFLKGIIQSRLNELDSLLRQWVQTPVFTRKNHEAIQSTFLTQVKNNGLIEQLFMVYEDADDYYFILHPGSKATTHFTPITSLSSSDTEILKLAQTSEFEKQDFNKAISQYRLLLSSVENRDTQAQMLNCIARCHLKQNKYDLAIEYYLRITTDFPDCFSANGVPLKLLAKTQMIEVYRVQNKMEDSLRGALDFYRDILQESWSLTESQFNTYSLMAEEAITNLLSMDQEQIQNDNYAPAFQSLKIQHQAKQKDWRVVNKIIQEIFPELRDYLVQVEDFRPSIRHSSRVISNDPYLISSLLIPGDTQSNSVGILGVKIDNDYLENNITPAAIQRVLPNGSDSSMRIVISTADGKNISGNLELSGFVQTISDSFEENFPPWKIEFYRGREGSFGIASLTKNFFFWTIVILIFILTFGTILIGRTIAQEMDLLRIKSDFVSSVSHELKTPLTSIKALVERLREGKVKTSAKTDQYYSVIAQDTEKLSQLVKNILDFSKIEEGKQEYNFVETDLTGLVTQQIEAYKQNDIHNRIKIQSQIAKDIPLMFMDKEAIIQALNNLVDNAIKFSQGKGEISISLSKNSDNVSLEVRDKGVGISPKEISNIFDKFYQGSNTLKYSVKGTGLGLTLVKHIVEAHGGSIAVQSQVGEGSTFCIIFPINKEGG